MLNHLFDHLFDSNNDNRRVNDDFGGGGGVKNSKGVARFLKKHPDMLESDVSLKKNVVVFMFGLPGSGKTTMVKKWIELNAMVHQTSPKKSFKIISADDFFIDKETGVFQFQPSKVQEAHDACIRKFKKTIENNGDDNNNDAYEKGSVSFIIVDNCNLQYEHVARYVDVLQQHQQQKTTLPIPWTFIILEPRTEWKDDPLLCFEKNQHGVPLVTIQNMAKKKQSFNERDFVMTTTTTTTTTTTCK
jgi:GTPase SAR1 family protein